MPPSVPFAIRQLAADDISKFREMLAMFGEAFDDRDTYTGRQPGTPYLQNLLGDGSFIALAALRSGSVIGGLCAYELKKFEQERSEIYIYDLAVAADYRRCGIATGLIAELRTIATARGVYVIFVQADPPDEPAVALYTRLGVREEVLHFDIAVPQSA